MSSVLPLCTLLLLIVSWLATCQAMKEPDCSKMVYHPKCRGVSAKRLSILPYFEETDETFNTEDSEEPYWKNNIDRDLMERIMRDVLHANKKNRARQQQPYYDEEI